MCNPQSNTQLHWFWHLWHLATCSLHHRAMWYDVSLRCCFNSDRFNCISHREAYQVLFEWVYRDAWSARVQRTRATDLTVNLPGEREVDTGLLAATPLHTGDRQLETKLQAELNLNTSPNDSPCTDMPSLVTLKTSTTKPLKAPQ